MDIVRTKRTVHFTLTHNTITKTHGVIYCYCTLHVGLATPAVREQLKSIGPAYNMPMLTRRFNTKSVIGRHVVRCQPDLLAQT